MLCPGCSAENPAHAKFCLQCGAPFGPSSAAGVPGTAEAERRQLTVLFCDLVGSTAIAGELDPEDLREVFRLYQSACAAVVSRFEGHIAQYLGDGLLVYFGFPVAHEGDAQRAVRAGLGMLRAVDHLSPRLERERGIRLRVRVGIHTGLVVAGEVGSGETREQLATGETPNIAARIQGLAEPDSLLISAATYRLVEGFFECQDLGPHALKGVPQPMPVFQVLRESAARNRLDVLASEDLTPLVGRNAEMELLLEQWRLARDGHGRVQLLRGEAGIGKSRLVRTLAEQVAADPGAWLSPLQCSPYYQNSSFYPVIDFLERVVLELQDSDSAEQKLSRLEGWLVQYGLPLTEAVPLFASLLSMALPERYPPLTLPPERQKQRTLELLTGIVLDRAREQPLLMIVEDLHWADPSSLELFDLIIERAEVSQVFVVFTFRPEFRPTWSGLPHVGEMTLERLTRLPVMDMVSAVAAGKRLPTELMELIIAKTDGIPLFVEELTEYVLESGLVREMDNHYSLAGPLTSLAVPATLQESLLARIDRLAPEKVLAQLGAAIGRQFSYELIQAVSPLNEAALQRGLAQLTAAGLIFPQGTPPRATYTFKHALIQDAAYQSLLKSTRRQYHQRIAQALAEQFPSMADNQPELLAHHYTAAGLAEQAVPYWLQAGQRALRRAANLEAISHFGQALEELKSLPESAARDRSELEAQVGIGPAYMAIKGWGAVEVGSSSRRARELAQALGDGQRLFNALWGLWSNSFLQAHLDEALETAKEVLRMALSTGQPMLCLAARHAIGYTHLFRGEFLETKEHAEAGLALFELELERLLVQTFQLSSSSVLRMILGDSLWMLGYPEQGAVYTVGAVELAQAVDHLPSVAYALGSSFAFYQFDHDFDRILATSERLLPLAKDEGFEIWFPFAMIFHGRVWVEQGRLQEGIEETRRGIALWRSTGCRMTGTLACAALTESLWKAGRVEEALQTLAEGLDFAAESHEHMLAPDLYRLQGEILLQQALSGEQKASIEAAETCFERSLEMARGQSARMLELRTAVSLGRLRQRQGRGREAAALIAGIYRQFTEGFANPDLQQARELLDQLGAVAETEIPMTQVVQ